MSKISIKVSFAVMCVFVLSRISVGQDATLQTITARMSDGLLIEVSIVDQGNVTEPELTVQLKLKVVNEGNCEVYFVRQSQPKFLLDRSVVHLGSPIPSSSGHGRENLEFSKIKVGDTYKGKIMIPTKQFDMSKYHSLMVNFAYIREFEDLRFARSELELTQILRNDTFMRAETVQLGLFTLPLPKK